jgi:hypothetical protein
MSYHDVSEMALVAGVVVFTLNSIVSIFKKPSQENNQRYISGVVCSCALFLLSIATCLLGK